MDDDCGVRRLKSVEYLSDIILDGYIDTNSDTQRGGKEAHRGIGRDANRKSGRENVKILDNGQELVRFRVVERTTARRMIPAQIRNMSNGWMYDYM